LLPTSENNKQKAKDCEKHAMQVAFRPNCLPVQLPPYAPLEKTGTLEATFESFRGDGCQLPEIE